MREELSGDLEAIAQRHIDGGGVAGAVILVRHRGRVDTLFACGEADSGLSHPLRTDSIFAIMSMTKPVTAACAALLIAEGRLDPKASVGDYLPALSKARMVRSLAPGEVAPPFFAGFGGSPPTGPRYEQRPATQPIQVHHLLNFTSGLQTIGVHNEAIPPIAATDNLANWVDRLGEAPLEFDPGSQWHYSNFTGYDIMGRLIEIVSGQSFGAFAKERLFDPLGMNDTHFKSDVARRDRYVPLGPLGGLPIFNGLYESGSGGLFSTAADYSLFAEMLRTDGRPGGASILPSAAVRLMRTNQIADLPFPGVRASQYVNPSQANDADWRYGYGVAVASSSLRTQIPAGSFGWDGIGTRRFWVIPALEVTLVMLVPGFGAAAEKFHADVERRVISHFSG